MAGENALITLRTNIKEMVAEVAAGVAEIDGLTNSAGKLNSTGELVSDIQIKRVREAQQEVEKLHKAIEAAHKAGRAPDETLTAGYQRIGAQARRGVAEDLARNKVPIEIVASIDKSLGPLLRNMHESVKEAVASGLDAGLVGTTRLRTRQNLDKIYQQTQAAQPAPKAQSNRKPPAAKPAASGAGGGGGKKFRVGSLAGDDDEKPPPKEKFDPNKKGGVNRASIPFTPEQKQGALQAKADRENAKSNAEFLAATQKRREELARIQDLNDKAERRRLQEVAKAKEAAGQNEYKDVVDADDLSRDLRAGIQNRQKELQKQRDLVTRRERANLAFRAKEAERAQRVENAPLIEAGSVQADLRAGIEKRQAELQRQREKVTERERKNIAFRAREAARAERAENAPFVAQDENQTALRAGLERRQKELQREREKYDKTERARLAFKARNAERAERAENQPFVEQDADQQALRAGLERRQKELQQQRDKVDKRERANIAFRAREAERAERAENAPAVEQGAAQRALREGLAKRQIELQKQRDIVTKRERANIAFRAREAQREERAEQQQSTEQTALQEALRNGIAKRRELLQKVRDKADRIERKRLTTRAADAAAAEKAENAPFVEKDAIQSDLREGIAKRQEQLRRARAKADAVERARIAAQEKITAEGDRRDRRVQILDPKTANPLADYQDLSGGKYSKAVNGVRRFFEISGDAAEKAAGVGYEITKSGAGANLYKYYDALGKQARQDTKGTRFSPASDAADLGKSLFSPTTKNGLADDTRQLTRNLFEVQRQGVSRFVQLTGEGGKEVQEGGRIWADALKASAKLNKADADLQHGEALRLNRDFDARAKQARGYEDYAKKLTKADIASDQSEAIKANRTRNFYDAFPGGTGDPVEGIEKIGPGLYKDLRSGTARYLQRVTDGLDEISTDHKDFPNVARIDADARKKFEQDMEKRAQAYLDAQVNADQGKALTEDKDRKKAAAKLKRQQDFADIFPDGPTGKPVEGVVELAPGLYKDLREATVRYFQKAADGLDDLGTELGDHPKFGAAARTDYKRRDKGFLGGLSEGVFGDQDYEDRTLESLGKSAGITAKYATLATVFYGVQGAITQAGVELLDFEDSLTDLKTAMEGVLPEGGSFFDRLLGSSEPDQAFLNDLSDSASLAGANIGQAMDLASSAIRAFGDDTTQSKQAVEQLGARFAAEASKIATLTKTDIADAGGNLKAISLGFDIPTADFSRVTDVLAGSRSVGGGDEKQVGQFLANIAVSAKEAGFAIEEVGALGSKVIAETDQGGQLVANRFSRLFSIIGGSAGKTAIANLNQGLDPSQRIDTGTDVKDQIVQLSRVYDTLGKSQQQQLVNSLGGVANARELLILLENADTLVKKVGDEDWSGKGAEQYKKTLLDVRGVLTRITGDLRGIVTALSQSGVIDPFIVLIKAGLLPALDATKNLLNTFNLIPRPLRTIGLGLLGIYATMQLIKKLTKTDAFTGALGSARGFLTGNPVIGPPRPLPNRGRTGRQLLRGDTNVGDLAGLTGRGGSKFLDSLSAIPAAIKGLDVTGLAKNLRAGLTGKKGLLATEVGPIALAAGGAFAVNESARAGFRINSAVAAGQQAQQTQVASIGVAEFNETAKNLRASAANLEEASSGFFGSIVNFIRGNPTGKGADQLTEQAQYNERQARRLKAFQDSAASRPAGLSRLNITGTAEEFQDSLDIMQSSGASATATFRALIRSLDDFNTASAEGGGSFSDLTKYKLQLAAGDAARGFAGSLVDKATARQAQVARTPNAAGKTGADSLINQGNVFTPDNTALASAAKAAKDDVARYKKIDKDLFSNQVETITKNFFAANPSTDVTSSAGSKALETSLYNNLKATLPNEEDRQHAAATVVARILAEAPDTSVISPETLQKIIANSVTISQGVGAETAADYNFNGGKNDTTSGALTEAKAEYESIKAIREKAFKARDDNRKLDTSTTAGRITAMNFNRLNPKSGFDQLDKDEQAAYVKMQDAKVDNMRAQFDKLQISAPKEDAAGRIKDLITEIDKEIAKPHLSSDKKLALQRDRAEAIVQQNQQEQLDAMAASRAKFNIFDEVGQATADLNDAKRVLKENFTDKGITTGDNFEKASANVKQKGLARAQAITARKFAKIESTAFPESGLETSQIAFDRANAELADLTKYAKGSTQYYQKLGEVNQKRRELANANANLSKLNAQLASDLTDPVQQDAVNLKFAKDKLKRDRKNGEPADVIAQDQKDVYDETVKGDADAFSQRLNDIQHAHDLGRISNQAFLEYMTSERTRLQLRLAGMKKTDQGYRQTVEQIQNLDNSIKSAADTMQGMFNIGTIDIPTPYQVRRALETKSPGNILGDNPSLSSGGNVTNDSSNKQVILNGVPIQQVLAIIEDLFGKKARASAKRRVA